MLSHVGPLVFAVSAIPCLFLLLSFIHKTYLQSLVKIGLVTAKIFSYLLLLLLCLLLMFLLFFSLLLLLIPETYAMQFIMEFNSGVGPTCLVCIYYQLIN